MSTAVESANARLLKYLHSRSIRTNLVWYRLASPHNHRGASAGCRLPRIHPKKHTVVVLFWPIDHKASKVQSRRPSRVNKSNSLPFVCCSIHLEVLATTKTTRQACTRAHATVSHAARKGKEKNTYKRNRRRFGPPVRFVLCCYATPPLRKGVVCLA